MFDHPVIVERFLDGWRKSGRQRAGLLLGRYTEFEDVPLGIRAIVSAIYEPPQVMAQGTASKILLASIHTGEYSLQYRVVRGPTPISYEGTSCSPRTAAGELCHALINSTSNSLWCV